MITRRMLAIVVAAAAIAYAGILMQAQSAAPAVKRTVLLQHDISAPGLMRCGSRIHPASAPGVFGRVSAAIMLRLARCVRSGPMRAPASVPRMVWHIRQA